MTVYDFLNMEVGSANKIISDNNSNILWSGKWTMDNDIPKNVLTAEIIKWYVTDGNIMNIVIG